jgi:pimeloyl-ACP methyl ester carboxylesterase
VVASDYPGFGQSDAPPPAQYAYTFGHLTGTIDALLEQLGIDRYTVPVRLRRSGRLPPDAGPSQAAARVDRAERQRVSHRAGQEVGGHRGVLGGLDSAPPTVVDTFLSFEATRQRHLAGTSHPDAYDPEAWDDEFAHLSWPGRPSGSVGLGRWLAGRSDGGTWR